MNETSDSEPSSNSTAQSKIDSIKPVLVPSVGAGAVILAELAADKLTDKSEILNQKGNVVFEPGMHSPTNNELEGKFRNGENFHGWNPEVVKRISSYQPESIAIDSLFPIDPAFIATREQDFKKAVWFALPERADILNQDGSIYVVAGDFMGALSTPTNFPGVENQEALKTKAGEHFDQYSVGRSFAASAEEAAIKPVLAIALGYVLLYRGKSTQALEKFSRRDFLKFVAGVGLSSAIFGLSNFPVRAATATDQTEKDFFIALQQGQKNNLFPEDVTNGRTALLIEKQIQALQVLKDQGMVDKDSKATVLMGNAHDVDSSALLNNPEMRLSAIRKLGEILIEGLKKAGEDLGTSQSDIANARNAILDYLALTQVWRATDFGEPFPFPNMDEYIGKHIELVDIEVPNSRIKEALQPLRQ